MTYTAAEQPRWRRAYERIAPLLVILCLVTVLVVSIATFALQQAQNRDRRERQQETAGLLKCFDEYASASAATSKAVRTVASAASESTTTRDMALDAIFQYLATDPPENDPKGVALFTALLTANADLVEAQLDLAKVRDENPVPDAPSTFCAD